MAIEANLHDDTNGALATTCTEITPGAGVRTIWFSCATACYVLYDDALSDASARDGGGFLIPAGVCFPIPVRGKKILIAADSGTPTGYVLGDDQ